MEKKGVLVLGMILSLVILSSVFVVAAEDGKVCCNYPGPADEPLYDWRASEDCQSPEGVMWGDKIVDDDFCEREGPGRGNDPELEKCRDGCKADFNNEGERGKCIAGCKNKFGFKERHDPNSKCENLKSAEECDSREACESIIGSPPCEGEVCTMGMSWQGCRYKYGKTFDELEEEYEDVEVDPGITPDSVFYFLDGIFGDSREEKIAEVEAMIEAGDLESARKALFKYKGHAEKFANDPDPSKRDEARRAAASISRMLEKIKENVPEEDREEFYDEVLDTEGGIVTSVEISSKIKELCEQLAELDPEKYQEVCRSGDDSSEWQKKLDKELTAEQRDEAKKFGKIMSQCFKTSGQDCACEEISFYDFSVACSKAAPLAKACDVDGDEKACDDLDNLKMPELPDYLQDVFEDIENEYGESKYDMHMPPECVEAGVTSPKECGRVMVKEHAPLECRAALLEADVDSEKEGREICDKIMFELHSPKECIDKGITDPNECGEFMDNFRGPGGPMEGGFGVDCGRIEDPMERLDCYDNKGKEFGEHYGTDERFEDGEGITWQCKEHRIHWAPDCETFMRDEWPELEKQQLEKGDMRREQEGDWKVKEKECAASCDLENGWWDFRDGECICKTGDGGRGEEGEVRGGESGPGCDDCSSQCPAGANTDCVNNRCVCKDVPDDGPQYGPGEGPPGEGLEDDEGEPQGIEPSGDSGGDSDGDSGDDSGGDGGEDDNAGITGNAFLDYHYN